MSLLTVNEKCEEEREERSRRANAFYLASRMAAGKVARVEADLGSGAPSSVRTACEDFDTHSRAVEGW